RQVRVDAAAGATRVGARLTRHAHRQRPRRRGLRGGAGGHVDDQLAIDLDRVRRDLEVVERGDADDLLADARGARGEQTEVARVADRGDHDDARVDQVV